MAADKYQMDMCHGPLFRKILIFALPLIVTYVLQLLFNAIDLVVIGHYASHEAMAAVGATMNINALFINVFIGLSIGANVLVSRYFGAGDRDRMRSTVHTAMTVALEGGVLLMIAGLLAAKPLLVLMKTPEEILPGACLYCRICFAAIPFLMLYNFGCAVLRAVGDTRRPLLFLIFAGLVNVLLNLFFVIVCRMDVGGVALATAVSHGISALLIAAALLRAKGAYRLDWRRLRVDWGIFREMLGIGIPAGMQSSCFAVSNMLIQSSINSFGALAMAGTTASLGLEGIVYVGSFALHQTAISFVAQNYGGRQYRRILKSIWLCMATGTAICTTGALTVYLLGDFFLGIYTPDQEVIAWGLRRMKVVFLGYGLCGVMDTVSGSLRGLGYSLLSAVNTVFGVCVFRVWWVLVMFPRCRTMEYLMMSYPISWGLVALINGTVLYFVCRRTLLRKRPPPVWRFLKPMLPRGFRFLGGSK